MSQPADSDCAAVWQAWVAAGRGREERLRRYERVPAAYRARVASHLRTVQAIEAFHSRPVRREASRKVQNAHRRVDRDNPYGDVADA